MFCVHVCVSYNVPVQRYIQTQLFLPPVYLKRPLHTVFLHQETRRSRLTKEINSSLIGSFNTFTDNIRADPSPRYSSRHVCLLLIYIQKNIGLTPLSSAAIFVLPRSYDHLATNNNCNWSAAKFDSLQNLVMSQITITELVLRCFSSLYISYKCTSHLIPHPPSHPRPSPKRDGDIIHSV